MSMQPLRDDGEIKEQKKDQERICLLENENRELQQQLNNALRSLEARNAGNPQRAQLENDAGVPATSISSRYISNCCNFSSELITISIIKRTGRKLIACHLKKNNIVLSKQIKTQHLKS